jgi:hypothetical protein
MSSPTIDEKTDALTKDILSLAGEASHDEPSRKKLLGALLQGLAVVETPIETIWKMIMSVRFSIFAVSTPNE